MSNEIRKADPLHLFVEPNEEPEFLNFGFFLYKKLFTQFVTFPRLESEHNTHRVVIT